MKIKCLKCNDIIESLSVHDYKECKCGACFIDGGKEYSRIGGDFKFISIIFVVYTAILSIALSGISSSS